MRGIVGADDHAFFAGAGIRAGMGARMMLLALEFLHAGKIQSMIRERNMGHVIVPGRIIQAE